MWVHWIKSLHSLLALPSTNKILKMHLNLTGYHLWSSELERNESIDGGWFVASYFLKMLKCSWGHYIWKFNNMYWNILERINDTDYGNIRILILLFYLILARTDNKCTCYYIISNGGTFRYHSIITSKVWFWWPFNHYLPWSLKNTAWRGEWFPEGYCSMKCLYFPYFEPFYSRGFEFQFIAYILIKCS